MFGKKPVKRSIRPGEKFDKRTHIDRRIGDRRQIKAKTYLSPARVKGVGRMYFRYYEDPKTEELMKFDRRASRKKPDRRQKGLYYRVKELWRKLLQPGSDKTAR